MRKTSQDADSLVLKVTTPDEPSHDHADRTDAHNTFRRLLLTHYLPKLNGRSVRPAIAAQTFNRWHGGTRPEWGTEAGQIAAARIEREIGCDTHWFDAGWFEGHFPNGVGNWFCRPKDFPRGLKPVGDACDELGLKFLVWYEPERVAPGTRFAREYPAFILPEGSNGNGGLFNLGDERARRFLTDLLIGQIAEFGIDTYRNDFNMDPLPYWRQNDAPDRQGITEIRYVEGLYAMWDEIRAKYPDMYLDDCASGGRRIDLEMLKRSIVQTRSDTACCSGRSDWDQSQTYGLSLYLPIHATIGWEVGAYQCRSSATAGLCAEWDILAPTFPIDQAGACVAEIRENQEYWYGDYYPLTAWSIVPEHWMAYQFHLPQEDKGIVLAFRREASPYATLQVTLRGIDLTQTYLVTFVDEQHQCETEAMNGKNLTDLELQIPARKNSLLVRYCRRGGI
ncbi:alpha-galactosidase [Planctomycetota bacterium]